MKKIFFILLVSFSISNGSYLIKTVDDDFLWIKIYCASDITYPSNTKIKFYNIEKSVFITISTTTLSSLDISNGYQFLNGSCESVPLSETYGLPYEEYNFLMALFGVIVSFLFGLTFLLGF